MMFLLWLAATLFSLTFLARALLWKFVQAALRFWYG